MITTYKTNSLDRNDNTSELLVEMAPDWFHVAYWCASQWVHDGSQAAYSSASLREHHQKKI